MNVLNKRDAPCLGVWNYLVVSLDKANIIWAKNVKLLKFAMVSDYSAAFIGITTQWEGGRVEPETGLRWRSFSGQWTATAQLSHNIIRDESPIMNIHFSKVKPTKDRTGWWSRWVIAASLLWSWYPGAGTEGRSGTVTSLQSQSQSQSQSVREPRRERDSDMGSNGVWWLWHAWHNVTNVTNVRGSHLLDMLRQSWERGTCCTS